MEGFDRRGQIRDPKTGNIKVWQPYTEHVRKEGTFLERPKGSGNLFYEDGSAAGRIDANRKLNLKAEHEIILAPQTEAQKLHQTLVERESRIAKLEAELIKKESEAKVAEAAAKKTASDSPVDVVVTKPVVGAGVTPGNLGKAKGNSNG